MMKKLCTLLALVFCFNGKAQTWQWAKSGVSSTTTATSEGYSVATDKLGNVYATGFFSSPSITFGTYTLTNMGTNNGDVFLTKYDANGNVLWAKSGGGIDADFGHCVTTDASDNVYVMGYFFSPTLVFGTYTLTNTGNSSIFLVKYSPTGTVLWAKNSFGTGGCEGYGAATDDFGNIYITGDFGTSPITFGTYTISPSGTLNLFLAKYDSSGNALWAKSATGSTYTWGNSVATDASGNIYITGRFNSPSLTFGTYTVTNAGTESIFLTKYDASGNTLWAKGALGAGTIIGNGLTTDALSNIYLTGGFNSSSFTIDTYTLTNTGSNDAFIAKYDVSGNLLWAKSGVGAGYDAGYNIATDTLGNVYMAGSFSYGSVNSITFGTTTLPFPSGGTDPMFVVKYTSSGNPICALGLGSGGDDACGVATDVSGNVFAGGDFMMNPFIVGTTTLSLSGQEDVFVAKANFNCQQTGIEELNNNEIVNIYPNPNNGSFVLEPSSATKQTMQVYDVNGKLVLSQTINGTTSVDANALNEGVYNISLQSNEGVVNKRIVIVK